ncbi:MAG: helix-turn-helix domain-containing protein [Planctomycetales bacterium]|nr:helix-turn-helix domain-containing protein [Planctomycetales bacterium]
MKELTLSILQSERIIGVMEERISLGSYIRSRREALGMTARALAANADIEPPLLSRIETGVMKTLPEPAILKRIARALGVGVETLTAAAGYVNELPPNSKPMPRSTRDEIERAIESAKLHPNRPWDSEFNHHSPQTPFKVFPRLEDTDRNAKSETC